MSSFRPSTVFWLIVFVTGAIGLLIGSKRHPPGFGATYAKVVERSFVEVEREPPIGANPGEQAQRVWIDARSAELGSSPESSGVRRVPDVEPIRWEERIVVTPVAAWRGASAQGTDRAAALGAGGDWYELSWRDTIGVWIAALCTLAILSFLWGDNPIYKLAECVLVGVSAAYWAVVGFWSTLVPNLFKPLAPGLMREWALPAIAADTPVEPIALVPLVLGIMLLMRLAPRGGWISVWPLAFIFGTTAGMQLIAFVQGDLLGQVSNSVVPLVVFRDGAGIDWSSSVGNLVLVVGILAVLTYFFFSLEHTGAVGKVSRFGVWVLMITFGAAFGFTVMGRITLLSERLEFLFGRWMWLIDPQGIRTASEAAATVLFGS